MSPQNPVVAACHHDPYPYYQRLLTGPELFFDPGLQLWVASSAAVLQAVFGHPDCHVRPDGQQVPAALAGSSAGELFSHLLRMSEGSAHARPKQVLERALGSLDLTQVANKTGEFAKLLAHKYGLPDSDALSAWTFDLPLYVVGDLLGFSAAELPQLALWMADFVRCLSC